MTSMLRSTMLALAAALLIASSALAGDWPHWRGPEGNGVSTERDWQSEGRADPLWSKNVGLGYSSFVVRDGRILTAGYSDEKGMDTIFCLDASTGKEIWTHSLAAKKWDKYHGGGTQSTPTIDGDHVFALNREGKLFCFRFADGEVVWKKDLLTQYDLELPTWAFSSSPLAMPDKLIVNVGRVLAFDKLTGAPLWQTDNIGHAYSTPALMDHEGRRLLVVFNGDGLVVFDSSNGTEIARSPWKTQYDVNAATPIVIGSRIFISSGYNHGCAMMELTDDGLTTLWENKEMRNQTNGSVLYEDHLYGFDDTMLKCLDLDGNEKWAKRGLGMGALMIAGGRLIVLSSKGELIVADASPGGFSELSRQNVLKGGVYWSSPVIANGLVFCRNSLGDVVCRDHRPR